MKIAIYPGSFDPFTRGHLDITERASAIFDKVIIGILRNSAKQALFSTDERVSIINEVVREIPNVEVVSFSGLTVDFAREQHADSIVRGLRAITDFEYEIQIAQTNRSLNPDLDTVFFATSLEYSYISSSLAKEIASYGGDIDRLVTPYVAEQMRKKYEILNERLVEAE